MDYSGKVVVEAVWSQGTQLDFGGPTKVFSVNYFRYITLATGGVSQCLCMYTKSPEVLVLKTQNTDQIPVDSCLLAWYGLQLV